MASTPHRGKTILTIKKNINRTIISPIIRGCRTQGLNSSTMQTGETRVNNSQAAAHESWLVRCSPPALGFGWSNPHDINCGRQPILLPWWLPRRHVPTLATYTANSAFPVSPFLTYLNSDNTKNYHSTTTVIPSSPPSTPKEVAVSVDSDVPH